MNKVPADFKLSFPSAGWYNNKGELKQVRVTAKLLRGEFQSRILSKNWREIAIPPEYLDAMHLPQNVLKDYMTCYLGRVHNKPAYLFWSKYEETVMLVFDF